MEATQFHWPSTDERELARLGLRFARTGWEFNRCRSDVHRTATAMLANNHSVGLAAFKVFNLRLASPAGSHMMVSSVACGAMATAYMSASAHVVALKLHCIAVLTHLAVALLARAAAIASGNPALVAILAWVQELIAWAKKTLAVAVRATDRGVQAILSTASKVVADYTRVATVVLQSRPADQQRGLDTATEPHQLSDAEAATRAAQAEWDAQLEDRPDGRRHHELVKFSV